MCAVGHCVLQRERQPNLACVIVLYISFAGHGASWLDAHPTQ